jgi:uncharacterized protein (DUF1800 family)
MTLGVLADTAIEIGPRVARHALSRLGYGPRPGQIRQVLAHGLERWIGEQLDPAPDPDLETRLRGFRTLGNTTAQTLAIAGDGAALRQVGDELAASKLVRAVHGANQLQEVLTDFWFNHFNVDSSSTFARASLASYERDAIRPRVLGRFRDLLGAVAAHPAMLYYLDNYLSVATRTAGGRVIQGLNENYGRELLELHTVGVEAGYTQEDVVASARCFTGWGIDDLRASGAFVYRPAQHDTAAKSVFGLSLPAGGGRDDGEKLLDHLAAHPATARFVSRKLAQRFVADDPPAALVDRMAATYLGSGGEIREVLRGMIDSPDFWAAAFTTGKPRSPLEFTIAALRAADAEVTAGRALVATLSGMGMALYQCVPPTGYSNRGDDWLNPSSALVRMNFALDLAANAVAGVTVDARAAVRSASGDPDDPRSVAASLDSDLFGRGLSAATLAAISRLSRTGAVSVATRGLGLCLAGPEMQAR